ncbi:hypothetical protein GCM10010231_17400 [Streptomyces sindenensis]|nr:hypothetical protein GCM10010231_17400 [Streptomyces sindenensis]
MQTGHRTGTDSTYLSLRHGRAADSAPCLTRHTIVHQERGSGEGIGVLRAMRAPVHTLDCDRPSF